MTQDEKGEKGRRFKRELDVSLSDEELQHYGMQLARAVQHEEALLDKKKKITADYNGQINDSRREQKRLADARERGKELRPVECEERWVAGTMQVRRLDTGELFETRPATATESQVDFIDEYEDDQDGEDPVVATPPGGAPEQHEGEWVTSSTGGQVHHMPDDGEGETTLGDTPKRKRGGKAAEADAAIAGDGPNGKAKKRR